MIEALNSQHLKHFTINKNQREKYHMMIILTIERYSTENSIQGMVTHLLQEIICNN